MPIRASLSGCTIVKTLTFGSPLLSRPPPAQRLSLHGNHWHLQLHRDLGKFTAVWVVVLEQAFLRKNRLMADPPAGHFRRDKNDFSVNKERPSQASEVGNES
jgi:hypothetical protein